ncbi:MAG: 6-phosphogluconolactonase [Thiobacillus sp.]|nr:6-phosphogluconolactonase [Thiobacillus sp.]
MTFPASRVFDTPAMLVDALADALLRQAATAIAAHGRFHLVLAGGTTPRALYETLAQRGAGDRRWHVWYGDERCLPVDDPERNSVMAETAWLAESAIPPAQRRSIPAESGAEARVWTGAGALAVHDAPKPPPDRVSLSAGRLSDSQAVWFVVTGAGKREALRRWEDGEALPVAAVRGQLATLLWRDRMASI